MTLETIQGSEWVGDDETPTIQGDFIENLLVLGRESKNAWNASINGPGDPKGPRRKFNVLLSSSEEIAKFNDKPANMLHRPAPRDPADKFGEFDKARATDKGLRMRMRCLRFKNAVSGVEEFHPQALALRDNIEHKRPFGGFSPRFDFQIDPTTGETQTVIGVESIDLVPQPATVRSALEEVATPPVVSPDTIAALEARIKALEARPIQAAESHVRTVPPPEAAASARPVTVPVSSNFRDFIRS